jgi:hypothetical protein
MKRYLMAAVGCVLANASLALWLQLRDGPFGVLADVGLLEDTTIYPERFSEWRFRRITLGMPLPEVLQLMGPPLDEYNVKRSGEHGLRFARSAGDGSYRVRVVLFRDQRVSMVRSEYYAD